ncbi:MAG: DUF58 domain-containing protein [Dehalococcoidales bacterium]|nr:DUF58 domain-containing protein [Dehalococcoidales bacterium]
MELIVLFLGAAAVYVIQTLLSRLVWKYKLDASAYFSERYAAEGDTIQLTEVVENRKLIPVATVKVNVAVDRGAEFLDRSNLTVSDRNYRSEIFALRSYERVTREIPLLCTRRGYFTIDGIDIIGNDLFYTRQYIENKKLDSTLCVYPGQAESRQLLVATRKMMGEYIVRNSDSDDPFTFRGIRPYESYDTMKDINWKASAKSGELRVNMHEYTADQEICILLDTDWDLLLKPDNLLEESIRIAASIADEFVGAGIITSMVTNGKDCVTGIPFRIDGGADHRHINAIRTGLARLEIPAYTDAETLPDLMHELTREMDAAPNRRVSWVLISTQINDKVSSAWRELSERAVKSYRIVPLNPQDSMHPELSQEPDVMFWEVPYGK